MKAVIKTIEIQAYTDEDGNPVCGECHFCRKRRHAVVLFLPRKPVIKPGPNCPIWRKQDGTGVEDSTP